MMTQDEKQPIPVSQQLPFDIRMALAVAAKTPITRLDPHARARAIDRVIDRAKASHPQLFRRD